MSIAEHFPASRVAERRKALEGSRHAKTERERTASLATYEEWEAIFVAHRLCWDCGHKMTGVRAIERGICAPCLRLRNDSSAE